MALKTSKPALKTSKLALKTSKLALKTSKLALKTELLLSNKPLTPDQLYVIAVTKTLRMNFYKFFVSPKKFLSFIK